MWLFEPASRVTALAVPILPSAVAPTTLCTAAAADSPSVVAALSTAPCTRATAVCASHFSATSDTSTIYTSTVAPTTLCTAAASGSSSVPAS